MLYQANIDMLVYIRVINSWKVLNIKSLSVTWFRTVLLEELG